jgi:hypothetical protein
VTRRSRHLIATLGGAMTALAAGGAAAVTPATASTPAAQTVTVPKPGHSVTVRWSGTILPGSDPTSDCSTAGGATSDAHTVTIRVPKGAYAANTTTGSFAISWKPASGVEDVNDEILTVEDPAGNPSSSDGSTTSEALPVSNPQPGKWTALACGFANSTPQNYTGTLTLKTARSGAVAVSPPPSTPVAHLAKSQLRFSHEVVVDHQRDGFEPDNIEAHGANGPIYSSVPSGSSTTTSYIWKSIDHGKSYQVVPGSVPTGRPTTCPQGGGDTELTVDKDNNLYFSDLQNLTNLTNGYSTDGGNTFVTSCASVPNTPVDRMWYAVKGTPATGNGLIFEEYDAVESSVSPNTSSNELVAVVSNDGVEFAPLVNPGINNCLGAGVGNCVTTNEGIPGNMVLGKKTGQLYIAHTTADSNQVAVSIGTLSGTYPAMQASWKNVVVDKGICPDYDPSVKKNNGKSEMCGASEFATIAQDSAGNLYMCFASHQQTVENGGTPQTGPYQVFVVSSTDGGKSWSKPVQVTRTGTNGFSWVTAGSNGRVAAAWYHSSEASEKGSFVLDDLKHAEFSTQMGLSLDAHALNGTHPHVPTYQIATVSEHPIKYGSICTAGLGCTLNGGDRSLGDFLEVGHNDSGRLYESYVDDTSSYFTPPLTPQGDNASNGPPVIAVQIGGPSLTGGRIHSRGKGPGVPYGHVSDPTGDAAWPDLGRRTPATANKDLLASSMTRDKNGLVLHMQVKNLADLSTRPTEGGTTGEWLTTFTTYDPGHAGNGSIYYVGMESVGGGAPTFFVGRPQPANTAAGLQVTAVFNYSTLVKGSYTKKGRITVHVPFKDLNGHGPKTKLYSVTSFTASALGTLRGNTAGIFNVLDSTPPYDYVVPSRLPHAGSAAGVGTQAGAGGNGNGPGGGLLADTGGLGAPVAALALLGAGLGLWAIRRRRDF